MFANTSTIKKIDLSSFDTSNVVDFGAMFQNASSLSDIDLSSFDTSAVTGRGMAEFLHNIGWLTRIKIGPKTNFHINDSYGGIIPARGTWYRESDNKEFSATELFSRSGNEDMSGTYLLKSYISDEMAVTYPVDFKINPVTKIDEFTTSKI